jgi:hypothetical protein
MRSSAIGSVDMTKLAQFKKRAAAYGQAITIAPFVSEPAGTYLDSNSGYPDPDSATYPAAVPGPTYGTPVTVFGFVQPARTGAKGEEYVKTPQGEEVQVALVAYVPGDQAVGVKDLVTTGGATYWVARVGEHAELDDVVFRRVDLVESVLNG